MAQRLEVARRCSVGEKVRTVDVMTGSRTRLGDREVEEGRKEKSSSNIKPPLTYINFHDRIHKRIRVRLRESIAFHSRLGKPTLFSRPELWS